MSEVIDERPAIAACLAGTEFEAFDAGGTNRIMKATAAQIAAFARPALVAGMSRGAALGDSIVANAVGGGNWTNNGFVAWMRRFCGSRIALPQSRVYAAGGYTIAQVQAILLPQLIAAAPSIDWAVVHVGHNSIDGSTNPKTLASQLQSIYDQIRAAGVYVFAMPILVEAAPAAWSGNGLLQVGYLNQWAKGYCQRTPGITYIDVNSAIVDFATGNAISGILQALDGIHPSPNGAMVIGQAVANVINTLVPARDDRLMMLGDVYDAVYNTTGNLLPNGLLAGTGGTTANGAGGTPPTSWTGQPNSASTVTLGFSKTAYAGVTNLTKSTMTLGGTADGVPQLLLPTSVPVGWSIGDSLVFEAEVDWNITSGSINTIGLDLICFNSGFTILAETWDGADTGTGVLPANTQSSMVLRTDPLTIPANTAYVIPRCTVLPGPSGALSATVNWARLSLRKSQ